MIRASRAPLIIAGGGVLYSEASAVLRRFAETTGIGVAETQAGKSAISWDHPLALGGIGVTGTLVANRLASEADLVIAIGTRLSDFTTMSKTAFSHPDVRFVGINVSELDAAKHSAIAVVADARMAIEELTSLLAGYATGAGYREKLDAGRSAWASEVDRIVGRLRSDHDEIRASAGGEERAMAERFAQAEIVGAVNQFARAQDVVVAAAGSLPGDLHKLWRAREPNTYHLEYGYSCMGYEIAGGLGVKMADPSRDVFVMVGDGSYLMMAQEIVTSVQEGYKLIILLLDSQGYASIGGLSDSIGSGGFGTQFDYKVAVDLAANAASLGAIVHRVDRPRDAGRGAVVGPVRPIARWLSTRWSIRPRVFPATSHGGTCRLPRCPNSQPCASRVHGGKPASPNSGARSVSEQSLVTNEFSCCARRE